MKLSYVIHVPEKGGDLKEFEKLRELRNLGYHGVELAIKRPLDIESYKVKNLIEEWYLEVSSIDTGAGHFQNGPSLNNLDSVLRNVAVGKIKEYIKIAAIFKSSYVTISTIRGLFNQNFELQKKYFIESLKECDGFAKQYNVTLLLEPLNRFEMDFINNANDAIRFLQENNLTDIKVLLDTFHMNIEDAHIRRSIYRTAKEDLLGHIHIADSNRLAPGEGHFDFDEFFKVLNEVGYSGFLTVEIIHPSNPDYYFMARASIDYLRKYINYSKARN